MEMPEFTIDIIIEALTKVKVDDHMEGLIKELMSNRIANLN
jgi:hypothetical protein